MTLAEVRLWGRTIGAGSPWKTATTFAAFQYDPAFARSGIEVSPLTMPLSDQVHVFSGLPPMTFHGLPGLLADSLPDRFGNALINAWLATQGRALRQFQCGGTTLLYRHPWDGSVGVHPHDRPRAATGEKRSSWKRVGQVGFGSPCWAIAKTCKRLLPPPGKKTA